MNHVTRQPAPAADDQRPDEPPYLNSQSQDDQGERPTVPQRADSDLFRRKLARLRELVEQALAESDPRLAALGIAEEAVLRMLIRIDDMIERVVADPASDAAVGAELRPLVVEMLRCAALAQRFAHLRLAFSDLVRSLPEPRGIA
jgi:hypothetical protein